MSDEEPSEKELAEAAALARALDGEPLTAADELPQDAVEVASLMRVAQPGAALDPQRAEAVLRDVLGPRAAPVRARRSRWLWGGMGVVSSVAVAALCLLMLRSQAPREAVPALAARHEAAAPMSGGGPVLAEPAAEPVLPASPPPQIEPVSPEELAVLERGQKRAAQRSAARKPAGSSEAAKLTAEEPAPPSAATPDALERGQYVGPRQPARVFAEEESGERESELAAVGVVAAPGTVALGAGRAVAAAPAAPAVGANAAPSAARVVSAPGAPAQSPRGVATAAAHLLSALQQITPAAAGSEAALERAQAEYRARLLPQLRAAAVQAAHARADAALARGQGERALQLLEAAIAADGGSASDVAMSDLAFRVAALALQRGDAQRALRAAQRGIATAGASDPTLVSLWRVRAEAERRSGNTAAAALSDARAQRSLERLQ